MAAALLAFGCTVMAAEQPNIVVMMSDDSGYSDLGCCGGEIDTPNLDRMAAEGLRFRNFYNNGRCSPSRASLMTGRDSAAAGFAAGTLGGWSREMQQPAYRARLPYDLPTIAEVMKASGYRTMMAGKWHLGGSLLKKFPQWRGWWEKTHPGWVFSAEEAAADFNALPPQRGFDEFFGLIEGETHHFFTPSDKHEYLEGNSRAVLPFNRTYDMFCYYTQTNHYPCTANHGQSGPAFYATDGMTDRALEMIRNASGADQPPFFMYVAYRAPHTPLQAPRELVDKYLPRYADLAAVEAGRVEGLVREGLWEAGAPYRKFFVPARDLTTDRMKELHLKAAVHAAMIEKVDENVGKVFQALEQSGELDNTLVIYLSDNGSASHLGDLMNTPYYGCKALMWEGGTKTHCIARWPGVIKPGTITESIGWIGDLLPTCLDAAGGTYPAEFRGKKTAPLDGRSLLPVLKGEAVEPPEYLFSNDKGQQGVIYRGRWKLLIEPGWFVNTQKEPGIQNELYDLAVDPAETRNLAGQNPELVEQLSRACVDWQRHGGIVDYAEILKIRPDHTK